MNLDDLEKQYNLPPGMLNAVMQTESNGNPNAVGPVTSNGQRAMGAFQFMPATAKQYGIDPMDPDQAAQGAARYYSDLLKQTGGDIPKALASYNWGPGNVARKGLDNAPKETQDYIQKISSKMDLAKVADALPDVSAPQDTAKPAYLQALDALPDMSKNEMYTKQAKSDTGGQNLLASIGGAMYGPYLGAKQLLGMASPDEVQDYKNSMGGLWSTPLGKVGTVVGGVADAVPAAVLAGPSAAGAAAVGAGMGALQPTSPDESRLTNIGLGAGGGVLGKYGADLIGKGASALFANKGASLAADQASNAVRDATIGDAQAAGYVIPPSQVNPQSPGIVNRVLEGLGGKIQTAQQAAIDNQGITNGLAAKALGLPENTPLTNAALTAVRNKAGQAYEAVAQSGPIQTDQQFAQDIGNVVSSYKQVASDFPSQANPQIDNLIADVSKPGFNSNSAVELIKRLRSSGFDNLRGDQDPATKALGGVQLGVQDAMEDLIDRNLTAKGMTDLVPAYQQARQLIAKSYTVQNALEDSTGKVVASKVANAYAKGKPLSDELATIGRTAQAFPRALQNMNTSMPGISPLDWAAGAGLGAATMSPAALAAPLMRPIVRSAILSKPYQAIMAQPPSYKMGLLSRQLPKLDTDTAKLLQRLGVSSGLLAMPGGHP